MSPSSLPASRNVPQYTRTTATAVLALLVFLTGCTGYNRRESRELFAADSLSRKIAEATPADTLTVVWQRTNLDDPENNWAYIGSVRYDTDGQLLAADVYRHRIFVFDEAGTLAGQIEQDSFQHPYLLGISGDTIVVHNAGTSSVDSWAGTRLVSSISIPASANEEALSVIPGYLSPNLFVKQLDAGNPRLLRYDQRSGATAAETSLPRPTWRHRGILKPWGNRMVSPSAYQPMVYLFDASLKIDSLRLRGFDSPVLNKTRAFVLGERDDPPLLMPSAAAVGDRLFVLNTRPGWTRIDVYDSTGMLQNILVQPNPEAGSSNTVDIDVRTTDDGAYEIAVVSIDTRYRALSLSYDPEVTVFRWSDNRNSN